MKNIPYILEFEFLETLRNQYFSSDFEEPPVKVCSGVAQAYSKVAVAWMRSPKDGNTSYLCFGTTSLLVPETLKFKKFET